MRGKLGGIIYSSIPTLCNIFLIALTIFLFLSTQPKEVKNQEIKTQVEVKNVYKNIPNKYVGEFSVTHYCSCPKCTNKSSKGHTATGHKPRQGRTIAVDPKVIPLHSIVYVEGIGVFVAEDVGGAIKGNRLDIYTNSHEEALKLGRLGGKRFKVYIL